MENELAQSLEEPVEMTQLAEQYPQIDFPQRMEALEQMNVPKRVGSIQRDKMIRDRYFSTSRYRTKVVHAKDGFAQARQHVVLKSTLGKFAKYHNQLKDLTLMAAASKRSENVVREASAYFSMGVLYDNMEDYVKAIECYQRFASISKQTDSKMEALAYNCIGVDMMNLGARCNGLYYDGSFIDAENAQIAKALLFHKKHLDIADDSGLFVANINIGLCLNSLNRSGEAAQYVQEALRIAIQLQSTYGQSIAVGNLGLLASRQDDIPTAKACMDQHLQLSQTLHDQNAEAQAWMYLGFFAHREQAYEHGLQFFEKAMDLASQSKQSGIQTQCLTYIGITKALMN